MVSDGTSRSDMLGSPTTTNVSIPTVDATRVDTASCAERMQQALDDDALVAACGKAARARANEAFRWEDVLLAYEREAYRLLGMTAAEAVAIDRPSPGTA